VRAPEAAEDLKLSFHAKICYSDFALITSGGVARSLGFKIQSENTRLQCSPHVFSVIQNKTGGETSAFERKFVLPGRSAGKKAK